MLWALTVPQNIAFDADRSSSQQISRLRYNCPRVNTVTVDIAREALRGFADDRRHHSGCCLATAKALARQQRYIIFFGIFFHHKFLKIFKRF